MIGKCRFDSHSRCAIHGFGMPLFLEDFVDRHGGRQAAQLRLPLRRAP